MVQRYCLFVLNPNKMTAIILMTLLCLRVCGYRVMLQYLKCTVAFHRHLKPRFPFQLRAPLCYACGVSITPGFRLSSLLKRCHGEPAEPWRAGLCTILRQVQDDTLVLDLEDLPHHKIIHPVFTYSYILFICHLKSHFLIKR